MGAALLRISAALERIDPRQPGHAIYCQEQERKRALKRPLDATTAVVFKAIDVRRR